MDKTMNSFANAPQRDGLVAIRFRPTYIRKDQSRFTRKKRGSNRRCNRNRHHWLAGRSELKLEFAMAINSTSPELNSQNSSALPNFGDVETFHFCHAASSRTS